jgi:hypothetical protein
MRADAEGETAGIETLSVRTRRAMFIPELVLFPAQSSLFSLRRYCWGFFLTAGSTRKRSWVFLCCSRGSGLSFVCSLYRTTVIICLPCNYTGGVRGNVPDPDAVELYFEDEQGARWMCARDSDEGSIGIRGNLT